MTKWKLVPVEPTPEMIKAGSDVDCIITGIDEIDAPEDYKRVFAAMLEAAPQPPKLSDERIYQVWGEQAEKTIGKSHSEFLVSFVRAIEREILGGSEK